MRKRLLHAITFEGGYSVDVGLLMDAPLAELLPNHELVASDAQMAVSG